MVVSMNETQAYPRAEQHLRDAAAALDVAVRLKPGIRNAVELQPTRPESPRLVNVEVSYSCEILEPATEIHARNRRLFEALLTWWAEQGYHVVTEDHSEPFTVVRVADPYDGFTVSLRQGRSGNLWFTASSPPVVRTGEPAPEPGLS